MAAKVTDVNKLSSDCCSNTPNQFSIKKISLSNWSAVETSLKKAAEDGIDILVISGFKIEPIHRISRSREIISSVKRETGIAFFFHCANYNGPREALVIAFTKCSHCLSDIAVNYGNCLFLQFKIQEIGWYLGFTKFLPDSEFDLSNSIFSDIRLQCKNIPTINCVEFRSDEITKLLMCNTEYKIIDKKMFLDPVSYNQNFVVINQKAQHLCTLWLIECTCIDSGIIISLKKK